ncbi:hypothetical protein KY290_020837 [Solanum tuberosum]|uniref:C2 domain-containing protein n=1 Tax=Solanum tuberosum TaxID=4113 RepID=A0ABQ7V1F3_SOLTU|nr:hypothetical protein KY285_019807 [Solanum tuberosum]KAH0757344.1 hypothetical protein KY290_020837 [Solanum tuberosum]
MGDKLGQIKVTVIKGRRLVIRDFKTSDPYVILKLGNQVALCFFLKILSVIACDSDLLYSSKVESFYKSQISETRSLPSPSRGKAASTPLVGLHWTAKTKVINSCLNPVWNEEFCFSISEPAEVLKLEVFDKDHFKADDEMGTAHLSLQPLVAAARLRTILGVASEGTTLRKVIPNKDNCLSIDSSISWVNGEVVQDVWLRLCDVESGDIELKIKLSDLSCVVPAST